MKQFDVYQNPSRSGSGFAPYLVVLSSHHLIGFDDAIVAPLVNDADRVVPELELSIEIEGEPLTLVISELSTLEQQSLKVRVGSLSEHEFDIRRALDRLFTGF